MHYRAWLTAAALLLSSFCSQGVRAEDYYWAIALNTQGFPQGSYPSPSPAAVCDALVSANSYTEKNLVKSSDTAYVCHYRVTANMTGYAWIARHGNTCPPGATYNNDTGECLGPEPDPCEPTLGDTLNHEYNAGPLTQAVPNPPPPSICSGSCQFSAPGVKECNRFLDNGDGQTDLESVYCVVVYWGQGVSCTANNPPPGSVFDQPPSKAPSDATPSYFSDSDCDNWETQPDGTQKRSCTGSQEYKQPGKVDCSGDSCKAGTPPPEYSKTDISQDSTKTTNPDGSSSTTTSTTTDKTSCKGLKPCTSTSKTESTTSGTDAEGNPTGNESSECTGDGCKPEGEEGEDEEAPEREAVAGSCDAALQCSGDPIDCEILRKQKEQLCQAEEMADFEGNKADVEGLFQGEQFELQEGSGDIDVPSFIQQGTRFLNPSCPPDRVISLSMAGRSVGLSFQPLCDFASGLGPFLIAVTAVICALYVGRSVGGQ